MKKMKKTILLFLVMVSIWGFGNAQNRTDGFQPHGKPLAKLFTNFHTTFKDSKSFSQFQLTRAYFGYSYDFSRNWSGKVLLDVGDPGVGKFKASAYLKNAYFKYKKDKLTASFGLIGLNQFHLSEKTWGNRYIYKSFQDAHKFNSSADLGVSLGYKFTDFISADVTITNGEGYKQIQKDSIFRYAIGTTIKPIENVTARFYADVTGKKTKQESFSAFLSYDNKKLMLAGEYNFQKNHKLLESGDLYGYSFFSSYKTGKKLKLFARYDILKSATLKGMNDPWNLSKNGQYIVAGLEYAPIKGVKLSPNIRNWTSDDQTQSNRVTVFLNCEIKF